MSVYPGELDHGPAIGTHPTATGKYEGKEMSG